MGNNSLVTEIAIILIYRSPRDDVTSHLHTLTTNHKKLHISDYTIIKTAQNTTLSVRP